MHGLMCNSSGCFVYNEELTVATGYVIEHSKSRSDMYCLYIAIYVHTYKSESFDKTH